MSYIIMQLLFSLFNLPYTYSSERFPFASYKFPFHFLPSEYSPSNNKSPFL